MTVVTVPSGMVADVDTADINTFDTAGTDAGIPDAGTTGIDTSGTGVLGGTVSTDARHARALAVLRSAEVRTGVRRQATASSRATSRGMSDEASHGPSRAQVRALPGGLANGSPNVSTNGSPNVSPNVSANVSPNVSANVSPSSSAGASVNALAEAPAVSPARPAPASGSRVGGPEGDARVLPVHPHLAALLPDGGLRTGTTVVVRGSTSLLLTLLAEASRDGAWTVLVGYPAAGMAAAADAGCDLARTLVVPLAAGSGVDASAVLAALVDGMDVVVVGPEVALLDQDRRRLAARARERGTVLLAALPTPALSAGYLSLHRSSAGRRAGTRPGWSGAHVVLEATEGSWAGIDQGAGWLRRRTLRVRRTGRGSAARPLHLDVELPVYRPAGSGAERAGEERAGENPVVRETMAPDGDVQRRGSATGSRLGLVG